jgi:hypothetical protein
MTNNRTNGEHRLDPDTKEWFKTKPKWYVTTLCICPKCGMSYKASIGHKTENCKAKEEDE